MLIITALISFLHCVVVRVVKVFSFDNTTFEAYPSLRNGTGALSLLFFVFSSFTTHTKTTTKLAATLAAALAACPRSSTPRTTP